DGSGNWFLSTLEDRAQLSTIELSNQNDVRNISARSLLTTIENSFSSSQGSRSNLIQLSVRNEANAVWRANGLLRIDQETLAVWPSDTGNGAELWFATVPHGASKQKADPGDVRPLRDVTDDSIILYGGTQDFNDRASALTVCLTLKNASHLSLAVPITLKAE